MNDPRQSASAVQFRLRSLGLIVLVICVLLAAVSPWLRQMKPEQLWRFSLNWLAALAGMTAIAAGYAALLRRAEARGGQVHFVLSTGRVGASRLIISFGIVLNMAMLFFLAFFSVEIGPDSTSLPLYTVSFFVGLGTGVMLTMAWWRVDQIQLREHGVRIWLHLAPWEWLRERRWAHDGRQLLLVFQMKWARRRIRAHVPEELRSEIEAFLRQRCADNKDEG